MLHSGVQRFLSGLFKTEKVVTEYVKLLSVTPCPQKYKGPAENERMLRNKAKRRNLRIFTGEAGCEILADYSKLQLSFSCEQWADWGLSTEKNTKRPST